jgi:hypothetical protein
MKVCGDLLGVLSFEACLYRLRLKKSDKTCKIPINSVKIMIKLERLFQFTAFNLPEQISFVVMVSKPPT